MPVNLDKPELLDISPEQARDRLLNWMAEALQFLLEERHRCSGSCEELATALSEACLDHQRVCIGDM